MNFSRPQKLKLVFAATVIAAAGIEGTVLAQRHQAPAGRDAFLNYQVDSTDELVAVLKKNATLRKRYARHFGIPEDRVIAFVKEALVPYRVPQSCVVTDHGVTKDGRIYPVKVTLKKGTKVWATRSGLPILKWACANPLAKTMPGTLMAARPRSTKTPLGKPSVEVASAFPSPILAPMPDGFESAPELNTPETVAVDTSALIPSPALSGAGSAVVPAVTAAPLGGGGGRGGPGVAPFLIPAVIAVAAGSGGGGGSTSDTPTDNTVKIPTTGPTDTTVTTPVGNNGGANTGGANATGGTNTTGGTNSTGGSNDTGGGTVPLPQTAATTPGARTPRGAITAPEVTTRRAAEIPAMAATTPAALTPAASTARVERTRPTAAARRAVGATAEAQPFPNPARSRCLPSPVCPRSRQPANGSPKKHSAFII